MVNPFGFLGRSWSHLHLIKCIHALFDIWSKRAFTYLFFRLLLSLLLKSLLLVLLPLEVSFVERTRHILPGIDIIGFKFWLECAFL